MESKTSDLYEKYSRQILIKLHSARNFNACNELAINSFLGIEDRNVAMQSMLLKRYNDEALNLFEELVENLATRLERPLKKTGDRVGGSSLFVGPENEAVLLAMPDNKWIPLSPEPRRELHAVVEAKGYAGADLVWLLEDAESSPAMQFPFWNEALKSTGIRNVAFKDWFSGIFGKDEYTQIESVLITSKADCRFALGYTTIALPSPKELESFRRGLAVRFVEEDALKATERLALFCEKEGIDAPLERITQRFIRNKRYLKIFGPGECSESFAASEWRLSINETTEHTEQTGTVAGYIKSVEQLLWEILGLFADRSLEVKLGRDAKWTSLTKSFLEQSEKHATLGNLTFLFSNRQYSAFNHEIYEEPISETHLLWKKLAAFDEKRNGKFHKTNFCDIMAVKDLRDDVIDIAYIFLGSLKLDELQEEMLLKGSSSDILLEESLHEMRLAFDELIGSVVEEKIVKISAMAIKNEGPYSVALFIDTEKERYQSSVYYFDAKHYKADEAAEEAIRWLIERYVSSSQYSVILEEKLKDFSINAPNSGAYSVPLTRG